MKYFNFCIYSVILLITTVAAKTTTKNHPNSIEIENEVEINAKEATKLIKEDELAVKQKVEGTGLILRLDGTVCTKNNSEEINFEQGVDMNGSKLEPIGTWKFYPETKTLEFNLKPVKPLNIPPAPGGLELEFEPGMERFPDDINRVFNISYEITEKAPFLVNACFLLGFVTMVIALVTGLGTLFFSLPVGALVGGIGLVVGILFT